MYVFQCNIPFPLENTEFIDSLLFFLSGIALVLGLAGGITFGGLVCRCLKLKVKGMLKFCVGASTVGLLFTPLFWAKCDPPQFAGLDVGYMGR